MVPRLVLLCVGIVVLQQTARAEDASAQFTPGQMDQIRAVIKTELNAEIIKAAIADAVGQGVPQENDDLVPIKPVPTVNERLNALEMNQREIRNTLRDQGVALGQISRRDEGGDHHILIRNQSARNELKRALNSTVPPRGDFIIKNLTGYYQEIVVNENKRVVIPPYETAGLSIPPGAVTTRLPGQSAMTWHLGSPSYRQTIELKNREWPVVRWESVPTYVGAIGWTPAY